MADVGRLPDGLYDSSLLEDRILNSFSSEKGMCNFIESNIIDFTNELGLIYKSHVREYPLYPWKRRSKGTKRIDFLIETESGKVVIEVKDPTYKSEHCAALGQILSYAQILEKNGVIANRLILVSSTLDIHVTEVISRFGLPIEYVIIDESKMLIWQGQRKN